MNGYLQRIALTALRPGDSIRPVLGSVFAPDEAPVIPEILSPDTAQALGARAQRKFGERIEVTSSFGTGRTPGRPHPAPEPETTDVELRELAPRPLLTSNRAPGIPGPKQRQKIDIEPLLPVDSSVQPPEGTLKPEREPTVRPAPERRLQPGEPATPNVLVTGQAPREKTMERVQAERAAGPALVPTGTSIRPLVDISGIEPDPRTGVGISLRRVIGTLRGEPASGNAIPKGEATTAPGAGPLRTERRPETDITTQDEQIHPATPSIPFNPGSEAKEEIGSIRRSLRSEPDEIQIHIGRIEVVAVPPAPAQPVSQQAQRITPSLDEYLRRRDRRSG